MGTPTASAEARAAQEIKTKQHAHDIRGPQPDKDLQLGCAVAHPADKVGRADQETQDQARGGILPTCLHPKWNPNKCESEARKGGSIAALLLRPITADPILRRHGSGGNEL